MPKIIGIVGSPRVDGNTTFLVKEALTAAEEEGIETELIKLAEHDINPCRACDTCLEGECPIEDDIPILLEKIEEADAIIIGSPVYFGNVTGQTKMFMDRTRPLRINFKLKNKIGGAVTVGGSRNGGQETTCSAIHNFLLIHEMIVVGDSSPTAHYGGTGVGRGREDCKEDQFGIETSRNLGKRIAELVTKI
ncbi:MAG TPA: flavodoxin family protein [Methanothermobacter sp.]|nr:NADPH-dependent FMN reductase [Methanothermobacter sp. MT-2]HHW05248.1 flavodoxin family protein [Methanothermobacter sp.]HOK72860.1 flavodoxin family protein [Methanothermobacter sp.]HOL69055.1 flavodoxin family protein [Methanothermobacter sp.]HPQ04809.1 flavodoxin family protein [Methanothermobacter sp.]